jgi:hypothetical protein
MATEKGTAELLNIRNTRGFTVEEKAELRGNWPRTSAQDTAYESELVRRLDAGEPLSKADMKTARRIKRAKR